MPFFVCLCAPEGQATKTGRWRAMAPCQKSILANNAGNLLSSIFLASYCSATLGRSLIISSVRLMEMKDHALRLPPEKKVPAASGFAMHHLALQYIDRCSYLHIPGTTTGLDLCSLFQPNALEGPVPNLITKCTECPNKAVHKLHTSPATTTATGPNLCILSNQMLVHDLSHV